MDRLIPILEQIRDQQKQQIANYERAVAAQNDALAIQRRAKSAFLFLTIMPWILTIVLLAILVFRPQLSF